ncbi:CPBP family intramembrane glutamic endopeptidase [Paenibacillus hexagrammi]|uniref:CPBP family intramembrane metalloprotease n=1 Tax=Paenibacillus hexagrammi TaxID=2908839 RepID=A0ABY3SBJ7_9BACL|nr:CPBP family intramembrane glutamic endopeptidase [Paenibacillus sp. YPD9-1]UJF31286.1 CPBP family intramembrane metalloprotease [Paenibacillus sp. YPD9-1]
MNERKGAWISSLAIAGKLLLTLFFAFLITVVLAFIAAVIVVVQHPELMSGHQQPEMIISRIVQDPIFTKGSMYAQFIGFVGSVFVSYVIFERRNRWSIGLGTRFFGRRLGEGFAAGVILISLSCGLIWISRGVKLHAVEGGVLFSSDMLWGVFLFICVGINEEMFARGYLQGLVNHRFGPRTGIAVSSLVFALLHAFNPGMWNNPLPVLNLLLAGLLFGVSREASGGLWMPIAMHFSWNFFQGNVYGFLVSGTQTKSVFHIQQQGPDWISGGAFGAEGSLITSMVLIGGILAIRAYYRKQSHYSSRLYTSIYK